MSTLFVGWRDPYSRETFVTVTVDPERGGLVEPLAPRLDLARHSDGRFDWGRPADTGPAQLALALMARFCAEYDAGGDHRALELYHLLKASVVANLPECGFAFTADYLSQWVTQIESAMEELK